MFPFLFFYGLFLIYPALQVAYLSFTSSDIAGRGWFIGLANYVELAHDGDFWASAEAGGSAPVARKLTPKMITASAATWFLRQWSLWSSTGSAK